MLENCFPSTICHSLRQIWSERERRSGLRRPNGGKSAARWGMQMAEMNFQTHSILAVQKTARQILLLVVAHFYRIIYTVI